MSDTLITVVAIILAAILMFIFPLMSIAERSDDMSQLSVQTATNDFVNSATTVGKITMDNYSKLVSTIGATGNSYDIEMEVKVLDENVGKKTAWTSGSVIGENVYYSVYTSQITDILENGGSYAMKEGDIFSVSIKNTNKTMAQTIRGAFYSLTGNDTYQIAAQHSGIVKATGSK
jgi:uncharacterized protein (UPF0333 family)